VSLGDNASVRVWIPTLKSVRERFYLLTPVGPDIGFEHPPLVSLDLFNRVQDVFAGRNKPSYGKRDFPFMGLIRCGTCGHAVTAELKKKRFVYYHCTGYGGQHKPEYYRQEKLDSQFLGVIQAITIPEELRDWLKECLEFDFKHRKLETTRRQEGLELQRDKIQTRMKKAFQEKLEGRVPEELWKSLCEDWEKELTEINCQLQSLEDLTDSKYDFARQAIELAQQADRLYLSAEPPQKRKLLNSVLSNCELKEGTLYPTYKKPFDILSQGHESEKWRRDWDSNPGGRFLNALHALQACSFNHSDISPVSGKI